MAKKEKRRLSAPRRERLRHLTRRWDLFCFLLALVIVLAAWQCSGRAFALARPDLDGFAGWFLLIFAYVPLLALSGLCHLLGLPAFQCNEAFLLGGCNLFLLLITWIAFRIVGSRNSEAELFRVAGNFVLMILIWGVFQIACAFTLKMWSTPAMEPLLRHFAQSEETGFVQTAAEARIVTPPRS